MTITPIEESFALLNRYQLHYSSTDSEQVDGLTYAWKKLQAQVFFNANPANKYMLKVHDKSTRKRKETSAKVPVKASERNRWCHSSVFLHNFEQISGCFLVLLLLTLNVYLCVGKNWQFPGTFWTGFPLQDISRDFDRDSLLLILFRIDGKLYGRLGFSSQFTDICNIIFNSHFLNMNNVYDLYTLFWTK